MNTKSETMNFIKAKTNSQTALPLVAILVLSLATLGLASEKKQDAPPAKIPDRAEDTRALQPGKSLPKVGLTDLQGAPLDLLADLKGQRALLIFYRGGWCPYCNTQLGGIATLQDSLTKLGYRIVGISPDNPAALRASLKKQELPYQLYSDSSMAAAQAFGIAFQVKPDQVKRLQGFGIDIEAASGQKHHLLPVPSVFLSDDKGVIRFTYSNPDYKVRIEPADLLKAAEAGAGND